jgi:ABC-type multidrug transport system ATPase subunit
MEFVNVTDLKKNYGDLEAVKGVSFGIEEGEVFGLLGPNGAGKTSIINMLIGLFFAREISSLGGADKILDSIKGRNGSVCIQRKNVKRQFCFTSSTTSVRLM